jgi:hypothetical protein
MPSFSDIDVIVTVSSTPGATGLGADEVVLPNPGGALPPG